jgi:hypothetical protein
MYSLGSNVALTVVFDDSLGVNFYPGNGTGSPATFTAPTTGKYSFNLQVRIQCATTTGFAPQVFILTPSHTYYSSVESNTVAGAGATGNIFKNMTGSLNVVVPLTASDVVTFGVAVSATTGNVFVKGQGSWTGVGTGLVQTFISGYRVA